MQNEAAYSELIKIILTKKDSTIFLWELDALKKTLFKTDPMAFDSALKTEVRKKVADIIEKAIEAGADKKELIEFLEEKFRKVPMVALTIAFDPTWATVERIASWLRQNVGEVLVDLRVDKSIVCGTVISYGGKYNEQIPRIS